MHGVGGDDDGESARADGNAAFGEEFAQAFHGAAHAFLRGIVGSAQGDANFAEGLLLEVAEQYGGAIGFIERSHGFVKQGFDMRPVGSGGVHGIQVGGDLLAQLSAGFAADDINGGAARDLIEPGGQSGREGRGGRQFCGVAGEVGEDGLGDFLGELRGADLSESGGMDQVDVPANKFRKGGFGVVAGIAREQLVVAVGHGIAHFQKYIVAGWGNPTRNLYFNSIDGGGALSKFRFMFKSHIDSSCGAVAFPRSSRSGFWPTLLLLVGLLGGFWLSADATENDDRYFRIYGLIEQGDAFNKSGQVEKAKAKYVEAEKALKELKQLYPRYNPKLVTARLNYLAEKIKVLSQPPVTAVEPNEAPAASGTIKAAVTGQPQVKLLEAGAEPRQVFRLQAEAGKSQKAKITMMMKLGISAPDMPSELGTLPPVTVALTSTVTTKTVVVGQIEFETVIDEVEDVKSPGGEAGVTAGVSEQFRVLKGAKLVGAMSDRFVITKKIEAENPTSNTVSMRESFGELAKVLFARLKGLPEEAIGVGAKWEVNQKLKEQGMTVNDMVQYELVSVEGAVLTLKSSTKQSAGSQKIPHPMMPGQKIDLTKLIGSGSETLTVDLGMLLPVKSLSDEKREIVMAMSAAGKRQEMTIKTETRINLQAD